MNTPLLASKPSPKSAKPQNIPTCPQMAMISFPKLKCSAMIHRIYQLMDFDLRLRMGGHFSKPATWLVICFAENGQALTGTRESSQC